MIAGFGMVAAGFVLKHVKVLMGISVVVPRREFMYAQSSTRIDDLTER